ncbi:MAG: phospholipid transport system substrate-binding protein [Alphaproteobacteria bacterium]|jgi:phospholipid transport system substrate-binding protein
MAFKNKIVLVLALFAVFSQTARADEMNAHDVVEVSAQKVMLAISAGRQGFDMDPQPLTDEVTKLLEPVVAFESISVSVMGKYKNQATDAQKERFAKAFKEVMVNLYAKALITFDSEKVMVIPAEEDNKYSNKEKVVMHVTGADDSIYKLTYSMRMNKEGQWQARNMIVDGINLGLTYLNQFDSAMNRYNKDMDKVIDSWQDDMIRVDK